MTISTALVAADENPPVIIVGGGLAGLELARHLDVPGGPRTLVLEAGPADAALHINAAHAPNEALRMWLTPSSDEHFWRPWTAADPPHYDLTAGLRRRLGGRSLYWHGVCLPLEDWALRAPWWPAGLVDQLTSSWNGGEPLYDQVRADLTSWKGERLTGTTDPLQVGPFALLPTPQAARPHVVEDGSRRWRAYSPADHWTEGGLAGSGSVEIRSDTEVLAVVVRNGRSTGVLARPAGGLPVAVRARAVVLAAGTIESTRLAIQALHATGATAEISRPGLADHLVQGVVAAHDRHAVPPEVVRLAEQGAFFYFPCPEDRLNLFLQISVNDVGAILLDAWSMGEQLPGDACSVECLDNGVERWEAVVHAALSQADRELVRVQRERLTQLWLGLGQLVMQEHTPPTFPDLDRPTLMLEDVLPRQSRLTSLDGALAWAGPLGSEYHEAGTLPIGELLGEDLQFHDVRGLYAVGPSVFPRPGAANPSLTSLALSRLLAYLLIAGS